jgi:hypothetical protein
MKRLFTFFLYLTYITALYSCDPERYCNSPKCLYSDVDLEIKAEFNNPNDSVFTIGDTIFMYMKIPDTMETNFGKITFGYLMQNSFFGIVCSGGDTLLGSGVGYFHNSIDFNEIPVIYGGDAFKGNHWNYTNRDYKCYWVPKSKGKYYIELISGRIEMTDNHNVGWLINPILKNKDQPRINQYLSWLSEEMRPEAYSIISQKNNWYCFEVR